MFEPVQHIVLIHCPLIVGLGVGTMWNAFARGSEGACACVRVGCRVKLGGGVPSQEALLVQDPAVLSCKFNLDL